MIDRLVSIHPDQSESLNALSWNMLEAEKNKPEPGVAFKYLRIL